MPNIFNNEYEDLASQGRYGDTMLAHINPEEAALLKARGGSGTINPQTGLPEFYFTYTPPPPEPLAPIDGPSIPQYIIDALPKQLETQTIYTPKGIQGGGFYEKQAVVPPPNAIPITATQSAMGGPREVPTGEYYIPLDMPNYPKTDALGNAVPPLVAKYDASGNFQSITAQTRYAVDENYRIQPEYNTKGQLVATGLVDNREGEGGGFGDFVSGLVEDFAPMIIAGLTANFLGPGALPTTAGATGAAVGSGALSPFAAQAAGAYSGSSAAAAAAAAGNLTGITTASGIQNALTQEALKEAGLTFLDANPSFKANYDLSKGGGDPGITATNQASFADPTVSPVDYSLDPVSLNGGPLPSGPGMELPTMPALNPMNGGQGLTTPAFADPSTIPGTVGAKGITPFNAVPDLGDPRSFINNPDVTGLPRLNSDLPPVSNYTDMLKNVGDVLSKFGGSGKGGTQGGAGGGLGESGSLQFGQSYLPGSAYSAPESSMVRLKELPIVPSLAAVLQQRGMNINQPSYAKGGKVHRPEFITGKTGHYAQGRGTGQSDDIPAVLHDGDYVVDADTVAAFGDGSSKAGAGALEQFRRSMPEHHNGGGQPIRAQIADGEYVLPAGFVTSLGQGSNKNGAKMLDAMREEIRAHKRSAPDTKIPPKAKKPVQYMREAMKG